MTAGDRIHARGKGGPWFRAALLIGIAFFVYLPAFRGGWIWDDLTEVVHNPALRHPFGWAKAWSAPAGADYLPLKTSIQWLVWRMGQGSPLFFHLLNVALHAAGALMLWRLLRRLGVRCAFLGGLLFAVHPMAVESVAWISELKNTLSLPLYLVALTAYVDFDGSGRRRDYALALGAFLAAALCKSSVVMLPPVLLLFVWWRRGRIGARDLRNLAPFFAVALGLGMTTIVFQDTRALSPEALVLGGPSSRVLEAGLAAGFYLVKCLFPIGLVPIYPRWDIDPPSLIQWLPCAGWAALFLWLWTKRRGWGRNALFGLGAFWLNLLPVLGFVRMAYLRLSWVSDHLAYISLAAAMGLLAAGFSRWRTWAGTRRLPLAAHGIAATCLVLASAYASFQYTKVFRSERELWTYTLAHNPKCWLAENDLGLDSEEARRLPEAMAHFQRALALRPRYPEAEVNLGDVLVQSGRPAEAIAPYRRAVAEKPGYAEARAYLGYALELCGDGRGAMEELQTALRLDPTDAESAYNLGDVLGNAGRLPEAIESYRQALRLRPNYPEAMANLGLALAESNQAGEAIAQLQAALRVKPAAPEFEEYLGYALGKAGRWPEAIAAYEQALPKDGANPDLHYNLADALRAVGRSEDALREYATARRLSRR